MDNLVCIGNSNLISTNFLPHHNNTIIEQRLFAVDLGAPKQFSQKVNRIKLAEATLVEDAV